MLSKNQSLVIGFSLFLFGSILFLTSLKGGESAKLFKAIYVIGILCLVASTAFQVLLKKIRQDKKSVSSYFLFVLASGILYATIVFILKLFS